MSETDLSPGAPEQIRGETLTPVSPKPLHYPSPSNIPILEASMDPAFSDTVTQSMQTAQQATKPVDVPEPLPSVAQHTLPVPPTSTSNPASLAELASAHHDNDSPEDAHMADDTAGDASAVLDPGSEVAPALEASMSDPASEASQEPPSSLPGPDSTSPYETQPSENDQDPLSAVDTSPSTSAPAPSAPEDDSIDVAAAADAQIQPDVSELTTLDTSGLPPKPIDTPNLADGGVDYSAILANLSNVIASATPAGSSQPTPAPAPGSSPSSALPGNPNLPPKPPAQEKPSIHPNYVPGDDLRNYHPHTQQRDNGAPYQQQPSAPPNITTNNLPPPPHAFQQPPPQSAISTSAPSASIPAYLDDEDAPFDPATQSLYDAFIAFERQNVHEGAWDRFPNGSRLFVGNLSTEKVQKRDVFRKFYRYGQIAQISLKQAYGFVQYMDAATCATALAMEQGSKIRGREIHLEVSKPAKGGNRGGQQAQGQGQMGRERRRSRSPDFTRGGSARVDRYSGSPRDRDNRRSRDDWRRSPSPRRGYGGGRDDRYDQRRRRSPSYDARDRYATAPPYQPQQQRGDDFDLPWRQQGQVPDVQILVVDQIDE